MARPISMSSRGRERPARQALLQRLALEQLHRDERRLAGWTS